MRSIDSGFDCRVTDKTHLVVVGVLCPNWGAEGLADADADADRRADDKQGDQYLDNQASPLAKSTHADARPLPLGSLGLLLPMLLARPYLAVVPGDVGGLAGAVLLRRGRRDDSLDVGIEGVAADIRSRSGHAAVAGALLADLV